MPIFMLLHFCLLVVYKINQLTDISFLLTVITKLLCKTKSDCIKRTTNYKLQLTAIEEEIRDDMMIKKKMIKNTRTILIKVDK